MKIFRYGFFAALVVMMMSAMAWGQTAFTGTYAFGSVTTTSGLTDPTTEPSVPGLTFSSFSAVGQSAANSNAATRFSFTGQPTGATTGSDVFSGSISTTQYYQFTVTVPANYTVDLTSIKFTIQRSGTGIRQYAVRSSVDSYVANLPATISPTNANLSVVATNVFQIVDGTAVNTGSTITLSGGSYTSLAAASTITFRFYGWNAEAVGGTFSVDDVVLSGSYTFTAPTTNFYSAATGGLDVTTNWGTNTTGTGTNPTDFTTAGQIFNIRNNATPTIGASWTVSGAGSKIVLGDGTNAVNFTIPDLMTVTGPIDLSANATLTLQNSTLAHTYGAINVASTINYAQSTSATVAAITFGNLTLTGGTKLFDHGSTTISGNLLIDGVTNVDGATTSAFTTINLAGNLTLQNSTTFNAVTTGRMTLVCNGTGTQTITGNGNSVNLFRITVSNSAGVVLSTTGGSTNVVVGNGSGGGITTTTGNLTTNSNSVTLLNTTATTLLTEAAGHYVIGTVTSTKTAVGTAASTVGALGLSLALGTDDLGDVTVTRVTGTSGIVNVSGNTGIARKYTITSTNPPTSGRDVTITWLSDDDNSKTLTSGAVWKSTNSGSSWSQVTTGDYSTRTVSLTGQTSFGVYTVSDASNPLPVELTSFTATVKGRGVELAWKTATEVNNAGFEVEKNVSGSWSKIGYVEGAGNSNAPKTYTFADASAKGTVSYRLKQIDRDGKFEYSNTVEAVVALTSEDYSLSANYPNPFNPSTKISFAVPTSQRAVVRVFNMLGQEVATLFNGMAEANRINTLEFNGKGLASGMYFYSLRTENRYEVKKMLMTK